MIDLTGRDAAVDWLDPVDREHPLNVGRRLWWVALPPGMGGPRWRDLLGPWDGTLTAGCTWGPTTRRGGQGQLAVAGSDARAQGNYTGLSGASRLTLAYWVRRDLGTWGPTVGAVDAALVRFAMTANLDGTVVLGVGASDTVTFPLPDALWHRVLVAFDGTQPDGPLRLRAYVDGLPVTITHTGASSLVAAVPTITTGLYVGQRWNGSGYAGSGQVDGVSAWDRPLTAAEAGAEDDLERRGLPGVLRRVGPGIFFLAGAAATPTPTPTPTPTTVTLSDTFHFGPSYSGLLAGFGYTVRDGAGAVRVARTNDGVAELTDAAGGATGMYEVSFDADVDWPFPLRVKADLAGVAGVALQSTIGTDYALVRAAGVNVTKVLGIDAEADPGITDANLVQVLGTALPTPNLAGYLAVDMAKIQGVDPDTAPDPAALDAITVESGLNARQALAVIVSAVVGQLTGATAAGGTIVTKTPDGATTRATVTTDAQGNRSSVSLNPPA
jgi:hypothetical protein